MGDQECSVAKYLIVNDRVNLMLFKKNSIILTSGLNLPVTRLILPYVGLYFLTQHLSDRISESG
jgi:hypothetical protein